MKFITWAKRLAAALRAALHAAWNAALEVMRSRRPPEDSNVAEEAAAVKEATEPAEAVKEKVKGGVEVSHCLNVAINLAGFLTDNPIVTALLVQAMGNLGPFVLKVALVAGIGWLLRRFHVLEWLHDAVEDLKETFENSGEFFEWLRRCWEWFAEGVGAAA
jgi:hypothetical protein